MSQRRPTALSRSELAPYAAIAAQLGLVVLVVRRLELVSTSFGDLAVLVLAGFLCHALMPLAWRLPTFLALSLGGIVLVLGPLAGGWLIALGLALLAACHLRTSFTVRILVVLALGAGLAALRVHPGMTPWPTIVWAPLASMFMFRLIVYLMAHRHSPEPFDWARDLSYFFLLPNVCFPLFPVVDYETFKNDYYSRPRWRIHQQGIAWMLRGLIHLLLYRLVYHQLVLTPSELSSVSDLAQFLVANILLYLRISGHFHLAVGILKLFGFDLPETNRLYFLAAGFNDYWRRINIYWKDFLTQLVYYPVFLPLRRRGPTLALAASVAAVFGASWLLHGYQWFWLVGSFPLRTVDGLFWGLVGLLVLANSLLESRRGRTRSLRPAAWAWRALVARVLRAGLTFTAVTILWSLWTSDTLADWLAMWRTVEWSMPAATELPWLPMALAVAGLSLFLLEGPRAFDWNRLRPGTAALATGTGLAALLLLTTPAVQRQLGRTATEILASGSSTLNRQDAARFQRGYYEKLLDATRLDTPLVELAVARDRGADGLSESDLFFKRNDFLGFEIRPSRTGLYQSEPFSSNRWGMRDREYTLAKPAATYRLALLGSSHTMGHGVSDDEVFDRRLERLVRRRGLPGWDGKFEVLNFSVADHSILQQLLLLEQVVLAFEPDAIAYVAHTSELQWIRTHLVDTLEQGVDAPWEFVRAAVDRASERERRSIPRFERSPTPHLWSILRASYRHFVELSQLQGARPIWIFQPRLQEFGQRELAEPLKEEAIVAGFQVFDLSGVFDHHPLKKLAVSAANFHAGPLGHRLIARALHRELSAAGLFPEEGAAPREAGDTPAAGEPFRGRLE